MKKNSNKKFKYVYLFVESLDPPYDRVWIVDNRDKETKRANKLTNMSEVKGNQNENNKNLDSSKETKK